MIIYVAHNGNPVKFKTISEHPQLGFMFTPTDYRRNYKGKYALDNGKFSAFIHERRFNETEFLLALQKLPSPDFVVIPDEIMAGKKSLAYSTIWRDFLPDSFNWYLAVQDGMTPHSIPDKLLRRIGGVFVGGSMDWKEQTAELWVNFAHEKGLKCHIGRFTMLEHLMRALRLGADSVDGSNLARHEKDWNNMMQFLNGEHKPLAHFITIEE